MQTLIKYTVCATIPYIAGSSAEKLFWKCSSPGFKKKFNKNLKNLPELDTVSEDSKDSQGTRRDANPVLVLFVKVVVTNLGIKTAIAGIAVASFWPEAADIAVAPLIKYGSALITTPGRKLSHLYSRIRKINSKHSFGVIEILFNNTLSYKEKYFLLRVKLQAFFFDTTLSYRETFFLLRIKLRRLLKHLKGSKREQLILFILALILYCGLSPHVVRRILADIVESYREYDVSLSQKLVRK